ncbi:hypothetical protein GW17_00029870 [Ensete ventricosum]|nr:hypothetical protein GW17_00029870 [Ensete ventricosum]
MEEDIVSDSVRIVELELEKTRELDLFTSKCISPLMLVGIETSYVDWRSLSSPRPERRSVDPSGCLGDDDPTHMPLRE